MNSTLASILVVSAMVCGCAVRQPHNNAISDTSGAGNQSDILNALSPSVIQFLEEYPDAKRLLTDVSSGAFPGKQVRLYYFYTNDEHEPRAFHFYRGARFVNIVVRKCQHRLDEYISILFEIMNSMNEESFSKLARDAEKGKVSRSQFPLRVLEIEHGTVRKARDLVRTLALKEEDVIASHFYGSLLESPDVFEDFIIFIQSDETKTNAIQEYLDQYDRNVNR